MREYFHQEVEGVLQGMRHLECIMDSKAGCPGISCAIQNVPLLPLVRPSM